MLKQNGNLKIIFYIFLVFILSFTFNSCTKSKDGYISDYEKYIKMVQKKNKGNDKYTEKDWIKSERKIAYFHKIFKRYENRLSKNDKNRILDAFAIYKPFRNVEAPFRQKKELAKDIDDKGHDDKTKQKEGNALENIIETHIDDKIKELKKITEQQQELALQLEKLRKEILSDDKNKNDKKTENEQLIEKMQQEMLQKILDEKKKGKVKITGNVKVLIFPANFKSNKFKMNYNNLTPTIKKAFKIILNEAKKYNINLSIDWEFRGDQNNNYVSIYDASYGIARYYNYALEFSNYNHLILVYVPDVYGRSYCYQQGGLGSGLANSIIWFKDSYDAVTNSYSHYAGTLAHEIFHTFGADDLYYEKGMVPQEVEKNFKKLLGNSIMIDANDTSSLDPVNAWLMGWNDSPELWYAWFVDRRKKWKNF